MRSPLLRLPPELQARILSHLVTSTTNYVLPVLYTCKQLYDVGLPFSVAVFQDHTPFDLHDNEFPMRIRALKFLRYITITKPELATHVKTIILERWPTYKYDESLGLLGPTDDEMAIYQAAIIKVRSLETPEDYLDTVPEWLMDLHSGVLDAIFALLLVVCSSLKEFCFPELTEETYNLVSDRSYLRIVLQQASRRSPICVSDRPGIPHEIPLARLEHVYHEGGCDDYGFEDWCSHAISLLQLPSLRSYECVHARVHESDDCFFKNLKPSSSTLQKIVFRKSFISAKPLRHILAAPKSLRSFEYMRGLTDRYIENNHEAVMPLDVIDALRVHSDTLEHLNLNFDDNQYGKIWAQKSERICIGPRLRKMVALKTLVIGMLPLTGIFDDQSHGDQLAAHEDTIEAPPEMRSSPHLVECLPENLERLDIICCGKGILNQSQELLDQVSSGRRFKHMRRIRFLFNSETTDKNLVTLACSSPSVDLDIVFQTKDNRDFDLALRSGGTTAVCSRLHDLHEPWLKYRYSDKASLTYSGHIFVVGEGFIN